MSASDESMSIPRWFTITGTYGRTAGTLASWSGHDLVYWRFGRPTSAAASVGPSSLIRCPSA
jgi:hypothetical protein